MDRETFICDLGEEMVAVLQLDPERLKEDEGFLPVEFRADGSLDANRYRNLIWWLTDTLGTLARKYKLKVWCITAVANDYRWCETLTCFPTGNCECKMVPAGELLRL
jgi:hypothetical protein